MDVINDRFGEYKVAFGSLFSSEQKGSHVISPHGGRKKAWKLNGCRAPTNKNL